MLFHRAAEVGVLFIVVFLGMTLALPANGSPNTHLWAAAFMVATCMTVFIGAARFYKTEQTATFSGAAAQFIFAFGIGFPILYASFHWLNFEPAVLDSLALNNMLALPGVLLLRAATATPTDRDWFM